MAPHASPGIHAARPTALARFQAAVGFLRGHGLQVMPRWSAEPYLASGQLVQVMPEYLLEPDAFGPWVHVLYLAHRRRTRKVRVFIEMLEEYMREKGIA